MNKYFLCGIVVVKVFFGNVEIFDFVSVVNVFQNDGNVYVDNYEENYYNVIC